MKILAICNESPYPVNNGQRTRSSMIVNLLSERHEVDLFVLHYQGEEIPKKFHRLYTSLGEFRGKVASCIRSLTLGKSLYECRFSSDKAKKMLQEVIEKNAYDVILCEGLTVFGSLPEDVQVPIWFDEHNVEYQLYQRYAEIETNPLKKMLFKREQNLLRKFEMNAWKNSNWISCCSVVDQEEILGFSEPCSVIPNSSIHFEQNENASFAEREPTLLLSASMGWMPNIEGALWFYENVWEHVKRNVPGVKWVIAGRNPSPEIVKLGEDPDITVTGEVESMKPYLQSARVSIVPLFTGSGTRIKILEAAQNNLPVVSTIKGAEGLEFKNGSEIIIQENPERMAEAIAKLLCNEAYWELLAHNGNERFEKSYSYNQIKKEVDFALYGACENPLYGNYQNLSA